MKKIWVAIGLNFALAVLAAFVSGLWAGVIIAALTAGWIWVWRRNRFTDETIFRIVSAQFCVCNMLMLLHGRIQ